MAKDDYICRGDLEQSIEKRYCESCRKDGKDYHGVHCHACWVNDMLGEIIDAPSAEFRRWISMDEQTPEEGKRVLICGPRGGVQIAKFCRVWDRIEFWTEKQTYIRAKWWMPLPDAEGTK